MSWNQNNQPQGGYGNQPPVPPPGGGQMYPPQPPQPQGGYPQQPQQPGGYAPQGGYPQQGGGYPPQPPPPVYGGGWDDSSRDHPEGTKALIISILGLLCCAPLAIWSLIISRGAKSEGSSDGKINAAYIISIIALVLFVLQIIFFAFSILTGSLMGGMETQDSYYSDW